MLDKLHIHILQQALDACSDIVFVKAKDGTHLAYNKKFKHSIISVGLIDKDFEILGKTDYDIFPKVAADSYRETDQQTMTLGKEIITREASALSPPCPQVIIARKRPLYDLNNNICGVIGTSHQLFELETPKGIVELSEREISCLSALFKGLTAKETAEHLGISPKTVETHIANIKKKTGVNSKKELIELAIKNNASYVLQHL